MRATLADVKYKPTGIEWMPQVPKHWEVKRLGGLFEERNETVSENDYSPHFWPDRCFSCC